VKQERSFLRFEEMHMANPFVHVELQTNDLAKAKAFYSRLFDWKLEDVPTFALWQAKQPQRPEKK